MFLAKGEKEMKRATKKVTAFLLVVSVVFAMGGMTALATEEEEDVSAVSELCEDAVYPGEEPEAAEEVSDVSGAVTEVFEAVTEDLETEPAAAEEETGPEVSVTEGAAAVEAVVSGTEESDVCEAAAAASEPDVVRRKDMPVLLNQKLEAIVRSGNAGMITMSPNGRITLDGVMPDEACVTASPANVEIEGIRVLAAYDITITDDDGEEYQPQAGTIRVHIENDAIRGAQAEDGGISVFHFKSGSAQPERVSFKDMGDGSVEFYADSFSIYVVGEDDRLYETNDETPHYIYTVNFYVEDRSGLPVSSQTLSAGERVELPGVPEVDHGIFSGWYTEPNGGGTLYDFSESNVLPGITEDTELDLYAHYREAYYVYYMSFPREYGFAAGEDNVVFHTGIYHKGDVLDTSEATALYRDEGYLAATEAVTGWEDLYGTPAPETVTEDIELYPVLDRAYWLYFEVGDGMSTSVDPMYVLASEEMIGELPEASCAGYTFEGWYADEECTERVTNQTTPESLNLGTDEGFNDSATLYAKWAAARVCYTVNIWRQKATDGAAGIAQKVYGDGEVYDDFIGFYDFAESLHVDEDASTLYTGDSLAGVNPTDRNSFLYGYTRFGTISDNGSAYYGFEYAAARTLNDVHSITVSSDGKTVINIFYDRVTVTFNFGTSPKPTATGTLIGLYGTNCMQGRDSGGTLGDWPDPPNGEMWGYYLGGRYRNMTFEATFVILNSSTETNFTTSSVSVRSYGYFYQEITNEKQLDSAKQAEAESYGVPYTRQAGGRSYAFARRIPSPGGDFTIKDKFKGYKAVGYNRVRAGKEDTATTYTPAKEGDKIMTSDVWGITFYDFYIFNNARDYTITLVSGEKNIGIADGGTLYDKGNEPTYTIPYGTDLSDIVFPGREQLDGAVWGPAGYYEFIGFWLEDPLSTAVFFRPESMPANNLVAYAGWKLKDITVSFVAGTGEDPEDQVIKATGTASDPGDPFMEGYEFVGWRDQNGRIFNFATALYEDTTLTALWKDLGVEGHTLTYDLNVGHSYGLFDGYTGETTSTNPEEFAGGSMEELWTIEAAFPDIADVEGAYGKFICWNTAADGSGSSIYPDDEIEIEHRDITLYAVWAHTNESTLHLDYNYPAGYNPAGDELDGADITQNNLTSIDLMSAAVGMHTDDIVTGGVIYHFAGWSVDTVDAGEATQDDVGIGKDASVAVDTIRSADGNTLHAVWMAVGQYPGGEDEPDEPGTGDEPGIGDEPDDPGDSGNVPGIPTGEDGNPPDPGTTQGPDSQGSDIDVPDAHENDTQTHAVPDSNADGRTKGSETSQAAVKTGRVKTADTDVPARCIPLIVLAGAVILAAGGYRRAARK